MRHTVEDYCATFESTAILCGLDLQPVIYTVGVSHADRADKAAINAQCKLAEDHAQRLIAAIQAA